MNYYIPEMWYQLWLGIILVGMIIAAILFIRYRRKQEKIISLQDDKIRQLTNYVHELEEQKKAAKDFEIHVVTTNHPKVILTSQRRISRNFLVASENERKAVTAELGKQILRDICESKEFTKYINWTYEEDILHFDTIMRGTLIVVDPLGGF